MSTGAPASTASRSAASEPLGVSAALGVAGAAGGGPVAGAHRGHDLRRRAALLAGAAQPRGRAVRAAAGPAAGRGARRARCRPRPRRPARRRARAAGAAARRAASVLTSTVGAIRRSPSDAGLRVVQQLGQRGLVVGAQERLGVARPAPCRRSARCRRRGRSAAAAPGCATPTRRTRASPRPLQPESSARRTDAGVKR